MNTVLFGCFVGVLTSAAQAVGLTLQRKSYLDIAAESPTGLPDSAPPRRAHQTATWRTGLALFVLSNLIGSSVQITTLPLVVLSPLQAVGLVFNAVCASVLLRERFSRLAVLGTVLVSIGATLVAFFGAVPDPQHNLNELLELLRQPCFISWMALSLALILVLLYLASSSVFVRRSGEQEEWNVPGSSNASGSSSTEQYNTFRPRSLSVMSLQPSYSSNDTLRGVMYGVCSGILSAHSLLMAKSAVELVVRSVADSNWGDYLRWQTWVIVSTFVFFAVAQLYVLNCGLRLCSTSVLYPLVFCVFNVTVFINGLVYFRQGGRLTLAQIGGVCVGTALVLVGVFLLSARPRSGLGQDSCHDEERSALLK